MPDDASASRRRRESRATPRQPSNRELVAAHAERRARSNILVVDDLPEKLLVFETILEELEQNVVTAHSGAEALRQLLDRDFAVILLDVNMPGMDGFETAALIRSRKQSAHTPIIFITAFADEVHTAQGYSLGAVDYILSPVVPEILRTKVGVFVDLFLMTQQVKRQAEERVALAHEQAARAAAEEATRRSTSWPRRARRPRPLARLRGDAPAASPRSWSRSWATWAPSPWSTSARVPRKIAGGLARARGRRRQPRRFHGRAELDPESNELIDRVLESGRSRAHRADVRPRASGAPHCAEPSRSDRRPASSPSGRAAR